METEFNYRDLKPADVAALFVNDIAYVKPVDRDGQSAFAIHAADGTELAVVENRDLAFATVMQNDLQPVSVH
jgi:hypothetical protein